MLEGYVMALLRVVEYPTQRETVAWIAKKARQQEPSTSTLRKTYGWRNRRKKIAKPRTTNEAQSGVSPVQNAATIVSHEDVTNVVVDIEDTLGRQLAEEERDAVAWTIENAGTNEEEQKQAIDDLIQGFRSANM